MLSIQGTGRMKQLMGRLPDGRLEKIKNLRCPRKHVIEEKGWKKLRKAKYRVAFVSSPDIYKQDEMRQSIQGWCHPFRNDSCLPKKVPKILLPESDFMDKKMVYFKPSTRKYDYFYFTINAKPGLQHKGLGVFLDILPRLCKHKLRGFIVVYFPNMAKYKRFVVSLTREQKLNLERYQSYLTFHWGMLKKKEMNEAMASCRFGLFPNTVDNSPRIISESLLRDVPILVNKNIHGGWHYVDGPTGATFDSKSKSNLNSAIEKMMTSKFHARDYYNANYGFRRSSAKYAEFLNKVFGFEYTHVYFRDFEHYLENIDD